MMTKTSHDQLEPPFRLSFPRRLLLQTATTGAVSPDPSALSLDSDVVLILAALLCALICVVGLALAARCAWLRRAVVAATHPAGGAGASSSSSAPNKGLKKKAIRALPKLAFSPAHRATLPFSDCPICLADFAEGEEVRVLPRCAHAFHAPCIDTWLASHSSCPSCRQNLAAAARTKAAAVSAGHPEEAVSAAAAAAAAGSCAATGAAPSGGAGRCLWCGAASSVVDADGGEQGAKGREDGNSSQYLP